MVAASAGNHAQGVAFAAGLLGCEATVYMPEGAPLPKVQATRGYGAEVILHGTCVEDALVAALAHAERTGAVFIHPYDHPDVVAGQGTLGFEIVEQCPQVRTVVVPVGGGGLAAGVAVAIKGLDPAISVVGVQAEAVAPYPASLAAGHPITVQARPTMADGIAVSRPGDMPFAILSGLAERVITVSEESLSRGLLLCLERAKQVVEPAGAAGVAALLEHARDLAPPVVVVLSGGNIDPLLLAKLLRHGLSAAGRYLAFRCRLPDHPGSLAKLLADLAALGANVLEVAHERLAPPAGRGRGRSVLQIETRGPDALRGGHRARCAPRLHPRLRHSVIRGRAVRTGNHHLVMRRGDRAAGRRVAGLAAAAALALLAAGCTGSGPANPTTSPAANAGTGAGATARAPSTRITITPANGAAAADPSAGITVTAAGGTLTSVTVRTSGGACPAPQPGPHGLAQPVGTGRLPDLHGDRHARPAAAPSPPPARSAR